MVNSPGREALLRSTIAVVADQGLRALTYRAVAAHAGVSHGLVRHHFGSRDQLIAAALEYAVEESLRETSMRTPSLTAAEFASGLESATGRDMSVEAFQYELLLESRRRPELREHVTRYYEAYRRATTERMHELGIHDEDLIAAIWFALDGMVLKELVLGESPDIERALARVRRLIAEVARTD